MKLEQRSEHWILQADEHPAPVRHMLSSLRSHTLAIAAAAVRQGHGVGLEEVGFDYPDDRDEDDEPPIDGVAIYDPFDELMMDTPRFEALMVQAFDTWIAQADTLGLAQEPWWHAFTEDVAAIRERTMM